MDFRGLSATTMSRMPPVVARPWRAGPAKGLAGKPATIGSAGRLGTTRQSAAKSDDRRDLTTLAGAAHKDGEPSLLYFSAAVRIEEKCVHSSLAEGR